MSFGKMNGFSDIVETRQVKDSEGFTHSEESYLAIMKRKTFRFFMRK